MCIYVGVWLFVFIVDEVVLLKGFLDFIGFNYYFFRWIFNGVRVENLLNSDNWNDQVIEFLGICQVLVNSLQYCVEIGMYLCFVDLKVNLV